MFILRLLLVGVLSLFSLSSLGDPCIAADGSLCSDQLTENISNLSEINEKLNSITNSEGLVKAFIDRQGYSYEYSRRDDGMIFDLYEILSRARKENRNLTNEETDQARRILIDIEEAHRSRKNLPPLGKGVNNELINARANIPLPELPIKKTNPNTGKKSTAKTEVARSGGMGSVQVPVSTQTISGTISPDTADLIPDSSSYWRNVPEVVHYSTHPKVEKVIEAAQEDAVAPRDCGMCYRFVKYAICYTDKPIRSNCSPRRNQFGACTENAIVPRYPEGEFARSANRVLTQPEYGFINLLDGPHAAHIKESYGNIPKGALLVYKRLDAPSEPGHIEIKSDWGDDARYLHYLNSSHPIAANPLAPSAGRRYELIGVLVKPNLE